MILALLVATRVPHLIVPPADVLALVFDLDLDRLLEQRPILDPPGGDDDDRDLALVEVPPSDIDRKDERLWVIAVEPFELRFDLTGFSKAGRPRSRAAFVAGPRDKSHNLLRLRVS